MKKIVLLAAALLMGAAHAANVSGKQTTPLTLKVNNFCVMSYTNPEQNGKAGLDKTYATVNLGTVNAVTNNTVTDQRVMAVDCNKDTVLNITTPTKVTFTNAKGNTFDMTTDKWDDQHPFTMAFRDGSFTAEFTHGPYQYYEVKADFKVGGIGENANRAWSIPGGTYTGDLVVTFNYDE